MTARIAVLLATLLGSAMLCPRSADAQWYYRFALRGELAGGSMLSVYQRESLGYGLLAQGSVRLGYNVAQSLSVQLSLGQWFFPSAQGNGGIVTATIGARIEPRVIRQHRLFFEANGGIAFTGPWSRLGFDLAAGFEFAASRWLWLGPVLRYGHVRNAPEVDAPADAQFLSLGLSVTLRLPEPEPPPPEPAAPLPRRPDPGPDADDDGVADSYDFCPTRSAGPRSDPARPGCPLDNDGSTTTPGSSGSSPTPAAPATP